MACVAKEPETIPVNDIGTPVKTKYGIIKLPRISSGRFVDVQEPGSEPGLISKIEKARKTDPSPNVVVTTSCLSNGTTSIVASVLPAVQAKK